MRKFWIYVIIVTLATLSLCMTSCSQEMYDFEMSMEKSRAERLYEELTKTSTQSLFFGDNRMGGRATDSAEANIHIFTAEGRNYLSTLSQQQFESSRDSLSHRLGEEDYSRISDEEFNNYTRLFNVLGGKDGLEKLTDFGVAYINTNSNGDWREVDYLLPDDLNDEQLDIYVGMAVYIDKIGRPVYLSFVTPLEGREHACAEDAKIKLALIGIDVEVAVLSDILTDGFLAFASELEGVYVGVNLMDIWLQYEICMGRWH